MLTGKIFLSYDKEIHTCKILTQVFLMNEYFLTTSKRTKEYSVLESCRLLLCLTFIHILRRITINFGNQLIFFLFVHHIKVCFYGVLKKSEKRSSIFFNLGLIVAVGCASSVSSSSTVSNVGDEFGWEEGESDGMSLGAALGSSLGASLGTSLGDVEGIPVTTGIGVGNRVGAI